MLNVPAYVRICRYTTIYVILKTLCIAVALNIFILPHLEEPSMLAKGTRHTKEESLGAPVVKMNINWVRGNRITTLF